MSVCADNIYCRRRSVWLWLAATCKCTFGETDHLWRNGLIVVYAAAAAYVTSGLGKISALTQPV